MKKFTRIGLSVLGGLIVLALIAPWLISLNQYKTLIQEKAYEATGRRLTINGDIRMGILPAPYARITDVVVSNPEGAISKDFATIKALDVGVALAPLFSKEFQITHITVSEPAITLEVMENGQNNWTFTPPPKDQAAKAEEKKDDANETAFSIDDLTIEKGFVRYVNVPGKSQQTAGPIDAKFQMTSMQGPVTGVGTMTLMDKFPVRFDTTIDSLPSDTNKAIPFKLNLGVMNNAAIADLSGTVQTGENMTARVETAIAIADLSKILAAANEKNQAQNLPDYLQGKTTLNGLLEWKDSKATINNLMVKAGSLEVLGSFAASMNDPLSVVIDLNRVVLPPEMANKAIVPASTAKTSTKALSDTLKEGFAQAAALLDTALPQSNLDVVITAAQLPVPGYPVLRDVRLAASSSDKGMTIQQASAKLPGNTLVKLSGSLPTRQDSVIEKIILNTDITSDDLQQALGNNESNKGGEKTPLAIKATTELTRQNVRISPLSLTQKGQSVQGDVTYDPKADTALVVTIKGNALNLDNFLGGDAKKQTTASNGTAPVASSNDDPLALLKGLKAKLSAELGSVIYQGKTAKDINVQTLVSGKGLAIQTARIGDLGGMVITASGNINSLSPLDGATIQAKAQTPNLSATLKALGNAEAANMGPAVFNVSVSGNNSALEMVLNGTIDQGKVNIQGKARDLNGSPSFAGNVDITHPETATVLRNFAKMTPAINLGAFALQSNVAYGANTMKADKLLVKLGSAGTLQGYASIVPDQNGRKIDVDVRADKLALAALMGDDTTTDAKAINTNTPSASQDWSRETINLEALRGMNGKANIEIGELLYKKFIVHNMKTTAVFANNVVTLERLGGSLFDAGTFNVNGQLAPGKAGQAHKGDFSITVAKTDAPKLFNALGSKPFAKGTLDMNQRLAFNGASPHQIVSTLNGDGQFNVTDAIINGLDLDALADRLDRPNSLDDFLAILNQASTGGQTTIGNVVIPITIRNGLATMQDTTIKTQKTAMFMKGNVNLPTKQVDMTGQITFVEQRNLPPLALHIKGPMNDPQKNFDTRAFASFYAQKATAKLQEKASEKIQKSLGKLLGTDTPQPAPVTPDAGATTAPTSGTTAPAAAPAAAPAQKQDPLKQLGGQLLNNMLGGGR